MCRSWERRRRKRRRCGLGSSESSSRSRRPRSRKCCLHSRSGSVNNRDFCSCSLDILMQLYSDIAKKDCEEDQSSFSAPVADILGFHSPHPNCFAYRPKHPPPPGPGTGLPCPPPYIGHRSALCGRLVAKKVRPKWSLSEPRCWRRFL